MSTVLASPIEIEDEREDIGLQQAFELATSGAIQSPNTLQRALFPRLLTEDTGLLVPTGPGAGRLEAVVIPSLVQFFGSETKQRLFIIGRDGTPLDDYFTRLPAYARAQSAVDNVARMVFFEEEGEAPLCFRFNPDGTVDENACDDPLDPQIDIVCTSFSRFRSLFFSAGGVHALPLNYATGADSAFARRDLFYFDEAAGYRREEFISFLRLVEFLFAEDLDVLVGTTTMPASRIDEFSFLEVLPIPEANEQPARTIRFVPAEAERAAAAMVDAALDYAAKGSVALVADTVDAAAAAYEALADGPAAELFRYDSSLPASHRREVYAMLQERERAGLRSVVVTDGPALEVSDLSFRYVLSGPATPEALVRRAGRCNRRDEFDGAAITIIGDVDSVGDREMSTFGRAMYQDALTEIETTQPFDAGAWIALIA